MLFSRCNDKEYDKVNGVWLVTQTSNMTGLRKYNVSINEDYVFDYVYVIYNLYMSGDNTRTYFEIEGQKITLKFCDNIAYNFEGTGTIEEDYKSIYLKFTAKHNEIEDRVEALFTRN